MKAIVRPNICTSLQCSPPKRHCRDCSHAIYTGRAEIDGRVYRWEHSPQFGPLFSRSRSGECDWSPHARHKVWQVFQEWHDRKFGRANATALHPQRSGSRQQQIVGNSGLEEA